MFLVWKNNKLVYNDVMKVNIICVGKIKEKYISEGIAEYQKRLSKFCDIKIIEVDEFSQEKSITKKIASESNLIKSNNSE